jgi:hypothetical protein
MPQGKTYVKIASQTLASTSSSITFSNIPQNYTDLVVVVNNAQSVSGTPGICLRFNDDTSTSYSHTTMEGTGSAANTRRATSGTYINSGETVGLSPTSNQPGTAKFNIQNYSNASTYKPVILTYSQPLGTAPGIVAAVGSWRNTNPITSININAQATSTFASGLIINIYGIEAAKTPYAIGGDKVYTNGTYWIHEFYNSGLFIPRQSLTADYLVVAGGGGAGTGNSGAGGGGGGAGGLRSTVTATGGGGSLESALSLNASTAYVVTIGAGGIGGSSPTNGSNSVFSTITSIGGGYGGGVGNSGGSGGGGGGNDALAGGSGTTNQGYAGGASYNGTGTGAGGGGGAGAIGTAGGTGGSSLNGGAGGVGVAISIIGSSVTYAGGGGGSSANSGGSGGAGGSGGGGAGATVNANGTSGTTNTGGGGGGARAGAGYTPGSGGSGIVIVRYAV